MMNLMAMLVPNGCHMGGWRHPDAYPDTVMNFDIIVEIARIAERGQLDAIFLADGNAVRDMDKPELFAANTPTARPAGFEPVTLFAALAQHTKHIGFVSTATTTYEQPYTLARKFLSLDHLSKGRAVWNVVTTQYEGDSVNFGHDRHMARDERYERAWEFLSVVKGLWDSWAEDAFPQNKETGQYLDPSRVHVLNHKGKQFSVAGPLNITRSPQGWPVICMAGQSEQGKEFAAAMSEVMFAVSNNKEVAKREYTDVKGRMAKYGRSPQSLRFLPAVCPFVGDTAAQAEDLFQECQSLILPAIGVDYLSTKVMHDLRGCPLDAPFPEIQGEVVGGTHLRVQIAEMAKRERLTLRQVYERYLPSPGGLVMKGTPSQVADELQDWYESGACDGFVFAVPVMPRGLVDVADRLVPELQRRNLFRKGYIGQTLRENMGFARPGNVFFPERCARTAPPEPALAPST
jgi:N-acetyl-S-(2-succino)cysteine monooxygenase